MIDREKVIKGLECCYCNFPKQMDCKNCPYDKICYHDKACSLMLRDALALLKEQEERYTWAKPEDRMPDTDGVCLIITDNGIGMVEYHSETKQFDGYTDHGWVKVEGVKWWCHAPKLPKK